MKLTVTMPWQKDLSVNHCRMGPRGNWCIKPPVEAWMERLSWEIKAIILKGHRDWRVPNVVAVMRRAERAEYEAKLRERVAYVTIDFRYPDKRKRDDHNYAYCIANAVASGMKMDDKDIRISTGTIEVDRDNPGFTITVEDEGEV